MRLQRITRHILSLPLVISLAYASPLDDRIKDFRAAATQKESDVTEVLKAGLQEHRSAEAFAATRSWLTANPSESARLLFHAAKTAEYAGEWKDALSFYRKLLKQPNPDTTIAGDAAVAAYRILINHLNDSDAAYLLMRDDGDRLRAYGRAHQFDQWFIAQAKARNDISALCNRLLTIITANPSNTTLYAADIDWVCRTLESYATADVSWHAAAGKLMAAPSLPAPYKARIDWAMTIVPFSKQADALFRAKKPIPDALFDKPLVAAEALIAALPYEGSILVAKGWMNLADKHSPNFIDYVAVRRENKTAPILKVLPGFSPQQLQAFFSTPGCPQGRPISLLFSPAEMRALAAKMPAAFDSLYAPNVSLYDKAMTVEEAKAIAPRLARNPHPDAALVRAVAAAGSNTMGAMLPVILKSETWRFTSMKSAIDTLWNCGATQDKAIQAAYKQHKDFGARFEQLNKQVAKDASSNDRMAAFTAIHQELQSANPQTPGLWTLWNNLLNQTPPEDAEKILQKLVADFGAAPATAELPRYLLSQALAKITLGNPYSKLTFGPEFISGWEKWGYDKMRKSLPKLTADLSKLLRQQMASGTLSEPVFSMWLQCVDPQTPEAKALFQELVKSAAYEKMDRAYHQMAANALLFGPSSIKLTPTDSRMICRELLALPKVAPPADVEAALKAAVDRAAAAPTVVPIIGLQAVAALPEWSAATRQLVLSLFAENAPLGTTAGSPGDELLVQRVIKELKDKKEWSAAETIAAGLWHASANIQYYQNADALSLFAEAALAADKASVAITLTRCGLKSTAGKTMSSQKTNPTYAKIIDRLNQVAGKGAHAIGVVDIPVDESNPAYPIYKSNAEFALGNEESAWQLYLAHADKLIPVLRSLSVEYSFWLLEHTVRENRDQDAENLIKELTIWSRQAEGTFSSGQEAQLKIAYADLAFRKGALPTARAWYRKVAEASEYRGTEAHLIAALGSVKVDRVSKTFGAAITELDNLMKLPNQDFRKRIRYARAEVLMDQETYAEALETIEQVLREEPKHPDALILRGKIHFEMRKLVEASEIELGPSQDKTVIVPGETIKINLRDPTLNVSGVGSDIEVEIWAKSGDRERVLLYQLGDSKEKFRADVPTAIGPSTPGDKVLQILGEDEIRFGYSQRFRAKMKDLPADPDIVIGVASDAMLSFSAGAFAPREGERRLKIEELGVSSSQAALGTGTVRPGNPVYVRVNDVDRSVTSGIDELTVSMQTSSGDEIRNLTLKETSPFSGEFQGVVTTAGAQAIAFASESAPGRDPNMAISPRDYPGWQGNVGDASKARTFGIDLNDNAAIDKMTVDTGDAANRLTRFVLQTSLDGSNWITRARFPEEMPIWDGKPHVSSFPTYRGGIEVSIPKNRELPADWLEKMELTSNRASIKYLSASVKSLSAETLPIVETGHPDYPGLLRYRALFYQTSNAIRRFQLTGYPDDGKTIFLLDGVPAAANTESALLIEREIQPGLHEIQIWRHASRSSLINSKPVLLCDEPGKPDLSPCPELMFYPTSFPDTAKSLIPQVAKLSDSGGRMDIAFGDQTRARLVRLVINGFEGLAPTIRKATITNREGKAIIPVAQDFMELRNNDQIEVLPGDSITVRYQDPRTATPDRERHEQRLNVAFNNAKITASFLNYIDTNGGRELILESIRRFRYDDAIAIVVEDPDMDTSANKDMIDIKVVSSSGTSTTIKGIETKEHGGRFVARIFPVTGTPTRDSEIKVDEGGIVTATYIDSENLNPGIPTERTVVIQHARYTEPAITVYTTSTEALPPPPTKPDTAKTTTRTSAPEVVSPRRALIFNQSDPAKLLTAVSGSSVRFDIIVPHFALAHSSTINAYVQTEAGRKAKQAPLKEPYDVAAMGTLKLTGSLGGSDVATPNGYQLNQAPTASSSGSPLDEGRFSFSIPLSLGETPERSFATKSAESLPDSALPKELAVKVGDVVHVGYAYQDKADAVKWITASYRVESHPFLDVMNGSYSENLKTAFVGEKIHLRLIDRSLDRSADRDTASVTLKATSGTTTTYELQETQAHSGIFKSAFAISYAQDKMPVKLPPVALNGFPARYGDHVEVSYAINGESQSQAVSINLGSDGSIDPFSKRFTGDEMAVRTSFTLAECFFELAKKHREMDQESLARREMAQAQKLLSEAIATHREDNLRAHAEYLLGNLAQEFADLSKNEESKLPMYQDALARFSKIPSDYPDSEFAPKAQFKTALVYEKMGEIENSVEEYVKLAYKYPKHELIPSVMSRLGGYFQQVGLNYKKQADTIRDKKDDANKAEVLRLDQLSYPEFLNAAMVFAKLEERFPEDTLAGLAGLRSGQNYMRAHQYSVAIKIFTKVHANEKYDDREVRSQSLYWSGISYERLAGLMNVSNLKGRNEAMLSAYEIYRRITFDFPDSIWAKYARGRLADPIFEVRVKRENESRARMINSLKKGGK